MRALDLFCGAGGATKGLQRAGFHVTGIDNRPQPRYCGDVFIQGDALNPPVRLEDFDLVWASPPCQGYSRTRHLPWLKDKARPLLIPAVRTLLKGHPCYAIENVTDSPLEGVTLRGGMFGLPFRRARRFESNFLVMAPPRAQREPVGRAGPMFGHGNDSRLNRQAAALSYGDHESIPPAYSHHIGTYAMLALGQGGAPAESCSAHTPPRPGLGSAPEDAK